MKKYDLRKVMKRAWEIKKEDSRNIFGLCLKMAWEEIKKEDNKITWEKIEKAADEEVAGYANGWSASWSCNNWKKGNFDRTYITIREYKNGSLRREIKCGYWDNVKEKYVAYDRYTKCLNLLTKEVA